MRVPAPTEVRFACLRCMTADGALEDRELPDQRRSVEALHQAVCRDHGLDLGGAVDIRSKWRPRQPRPEVQDRDGDSSEIRVTWVDEAKSATRQGRRSTDERGHVRVAADDPVERDEVGGTDVIGVRDEVSGEVTDSVGVALPFGLRAGRRDVGPRCVHVDGARSPGAQQLVVDSANAAAHIENGLPLDAAGAERLDEVARETPWAVALVVAQLLGSMARVELAVVR